MSERTDILQQELEEYTGQDLYPFHMPGHKRRCAPAAGLPYRTDLTEVDGVDDLHHAQGILRAAMDRTAALFGSARCWYLVGGSTVGNLAGIRAIAPYGSEVIVARNCHKSVYHIIELQNLKVHWIWPPVDPSFDIFGSVLPEAVADALQRFPASRAVILTSPTYEGVVSDIRSIASICHEHGAPLFVDEAHGAHFGLFERDFFPDSAVHCGADLVVQSAHKTLPSLTQTALLHLGIRSTLVSPAAVERQLDVFETSSPSYPMMASLDGCTGRIQNKGATMFRGWRGQLQALQDTLEEHHLQHLQVLCYGEDSLNRHPAFYDFDPGKILIRSRMGGAALAKRLRLDYGLETEMHCGKNVLCMTSCCDAEEAFGRLTRALYQIDGQIDKEGGPSVFDVEAAKEGWPMGKLQETAGAISLGEAVRRPVETLPAEKSLGRLSGEYIYPYPPGIPVLVPGEVITRDCLRLIRMLEDQGSQIIRSSGETDASAVVCLTASA